MTKKPAGPNKPVVQAPAPVPQAPKALEPEVKAPVDAAPKAPEPEAPKTPEPKIETSRIVGPLDLVAVGYVYGIQGFGKEPVPPTRKFTAPNQHTYDMLVRTGNARPA